MKFFTVAFMFMFLALVNVSVLHADSKAVEKFNKECISGNTKSCFELGLIYANGQGVSKDSKKAVEFYSKACDANYSDGCVNLAMMHAIGEGVAVDYDQALHISEKGCDLGNENACKFNKILSDTMKK